MTDALMGASPWRRVDRSEAKVTILVIEDEAMLREVLQITLERSGFRVLMAGGGDEALDLCESSPEAIDLVLTDIVMPGTSGTDLAGYLAIRYAERRLVDLLEEKGFAVLVEECTALQEFDWARLTFELDNYMFEVHRLVAALYRIQ